MSGKISGVSNSPPASAPSSAGARAAATASQTSSATSAAADSVQITDTASHLATVEQALSEVPVINQGRVAEISDALAAGTYEISPDRIANQLLLFERLLPQDPAE
ncbi:MAG TPA: flagellar biosynthesis anti-sigma factor FlgM [Steroidobacteraceae bacterium]|nr:flagellar biosynthesis anti-sigma factor FlgM [Steroidobacteraceae bacterium]